MSQPFLSVIVPCYKTASTMVQTLDSVLAQGEGVEIIVVNDGSPDNTAEIAQGYGDKIVYIEQANAGVAAARNNGLANAKGEFIYFLDADDILLPGMVDAFRSAALRDPTVDIWYADIQVSDDDLNITRILKMSFDHSDALHQMLIHCRLMPQGVIVRTSLLHKIDGLDVDLAGVDDWDLWVRLSEAGAKYEKIAGEWSIWRFRTGSQSKQFLRYWELHRAFFAKHKALYEKHTTQGERDELINHTLDRDLPHLYGDDLNKPWIKRRVGRTLAILKAAPKAKGLLPWMVRRAFGNLGRRLSRSS